jgi:hypothetical protein
MRPLTDEEYAKTAWRKKQVALSPPGKVRQVVSMQERATISDGMLLFVGRNGRGKTCALEAVMGCRRAAKLIAGVKGRYVS